MHCFVRSHPGRRQMGCDHWCQYCCVVLIGVPASVDGTACRILRHGFISAMHVCMFAWVCVSYFGCYQNVEDGGLKSIVSSHAIYFVSLFLLCSKFQLRPSTCTSVVSRRVLYTQLCHSQWHRQVANDKFLSNIVVFAHVLFDSVFSPHLS